MHLVPSFGKQKNRIASACLFILLLLSGMCGATPLTVGFIAGGAGLGDESYNDMTWRGLAKAREKYGIRLIYAETKDNDDSRLAALEDLLSAGANVVVCNEAGLPPLVIKIAAERPEVYFILNDYHVSGYDNIASTTFANHEGAFLAGVLAGAMTRTQRIGFVGGVRMCLVKSFQQGFVEGVGYINPKATVMSRFIAEDGNYSGFNNPGAGYALATSLYRQEADIIFAVAGLSGNGIIQAARTHKRYVIGVDADQDHMARGLILTSMVKRLDRASFMEVEKILNHRFQPGESVYNLANGGVSLSPMRFTREAIPEAVHNELKRVESKIISGELTVPQCREETP